MEYLGITITWGNTIFDDNTIRKMITTKYSDLKSFKKAWLNLSHCNDDINRQAKLDTLSIESSEYVSCEEYFKYMEEEE